MEPRLDSENSIPLHFTGGLTSHYPCWEMGTALSHNCNFVATDEGDERRRTSWTGVARPSNLQGIIVPPLLYCFLPRPVQGLQFLSSQIYNTKRKYDLFLMISNFFQTSYITYISFGIPFESFNKERKKSYHHICKC